MVLTAQLDLEEKFCYVWALSSLSDPQPLRVAWQRRGRVESRVLGQILPEESYEFSKGSFVQSWFFWFLSLRVSPRVREESGAEGFSANPTCSGVLFAHIAARRSTPSPN
jgi:hypothetical protein